MDTMRWLVVILLISLLPVGIGCVRPKRASSPTKKEDTATTPVRRINPTRLSPFETAPPTAPTGSTEVRPTTTGSTSPAATPPANTAPRPTTPVLPTATNPVLPTTTQPKSTGTGPVSPTPPQGTAPVK